MVNVMQEKSGLSYRPEGWATPYDHDQAMESKRSIFEDGANAMLWTLLKDAQEYGLTAHHYMRHDDCLCDVLAHGLKLL
jgi:hypothetical protein